MRNRRYRPLSVVLCAVVLGACDAGNVPIEDPGGSAQTVTVAIRPPDADVDAESTAAFTAEVLGTADGRVTWSISPGGGSVDATGNYTAPAAEGDYDLVATSVADASVRAKATIRVRRWQAAPTIVSFSAAPPSITAGASATLSWSVTGATSLAIAPGIGTVTGSSVTVNPSATTSYTLTARNAAGASTAIATVTVAAAAAGTQAPARPTIASFAASPASIGAGAASTLSWSTSGATSVTIDGGIGSVASSGTRTVSPGATTAYTLSAVNAAGTVTATAIVTVSPAPVATPTFSPAGGTYASSQSVTISDATSGAVLHYTTDGSTPTCSSATYGSALSVASTTTVRAVGCKTGMTTSPVAGATYTIGAASGAVPGTGAHAAPRYVTGVTGGGATSDTCRGASCVPNCPGSGCVTLTGAAGDCVTDDTLAFRRAIAAAGTKPVYVPRPAGPCYKVTPAGSYSYLATLLVNNGGLVGEVGAYPKIKMFGATGDGDGGSILGEILRTQPVVIAGLDLDGGANLQPLVSSLGGFPGGAPYTDWAYDACIALVASSNFTIRDNFLHDCMGDAVYVTGSNEIGHDVKNGVVDSNTMVDVTRQVVAITGSGGPGDTGIVVTNNRLGQTWGYGGVLDAEPNKANDWLYNVEFAYNVVNMTTHTTGWNGTCVNFDSAGTAAAGGNLYSHDNTAGTPLGFGHGWCLNSPQWNPSFTNMHVCASPGN